MKQENKKTFVASDIHLNHANILSYCQHRDNRGMTVEQLEVLHEENIDAYLELTREAIFSMNELIISNWNSVVAPKDDVYILGDVAMGQIVEAPALIRRMNGNKMLVRGNHDKTLSKRIKTDPEYADLFVWVRDYYEVGYKHSVTGKKYSLVMSHFPFRMWNHMSQGSMMLHGHLHGSPCDVPGRIKDVGIDTNNLKPYLMEDVIDQLAVITEFGNHH